jgi:hypothetical protein
MVDRRAVGGGKRRAPAPAHEAFGARVAVRRAQRTPMDAATRATVKFVDSIATFNAPPPRRSFVSVSGSILYL